MSERTVSVGVHRAYPQRDGQAELAWGGLVT